MSGAKRFLSVTLALAVALSLLSAPTFTIAGDNVYEDVPSGHWAYDVIAKWSGDGYGVLVGDGDGTFAPNRGLLLGELAAILSKSLGYAERADAEVTPDWADEHVEKAVAAGIIGAADIIDASVTVTREQAIRYIALAYNVAPVAGETSFVDDGLIDSEYKPYVNAFQKLGYVVGKGNNDFDPKGVYTRAEAMAVLNNTTSDILDQSAVGKTYSKNVIIRSAGITLSDTTVGGNLIIGQGAGDSVITLENVTINGLLIILGDATVILNGQTITKDGAVDEPGAPATPTDPPSGDSGDSPGGGLGGGSAGGGGSPPSPTPSPSPSPSPPIATEGFILDVSSGGNYLDVSMSANGSSKLIVEVYAEDTSLDNLLASGSLTLDGEVEFDLANPNPQRVGVALPTYFIAVVTLTDGRGKQLCEPYYYIERTEGYEEFKNTKPGDFSGDRVIIIDPADPDDNFMAVGVGVFLIYEGENGENILGVTDLDAGIYGFLNPCATVSGLQAGDLIVFVCADGSFLLIKVKENTPGAGMAMVLAETEQDLEEFFDHIDVNLTEEIEDDGTVSPIMYSFSGFSPDAELFSQLNTAGFKHTGTYARVFAGSGGQNYRLTATAKFNPYVTASVSYSVKWKWIFPVGFSLKAQIGIGVETEITATSVKTTAAATNPSTKIFSGNVSVKGLTSFGATLDMIIDGTVNGEGSASIGVKAECGINFNNFNFSTYATRSLTKNLDYTGDFRVTIGPKLTMQVGSVLGVIRDVNLTAHPKVKIDAEVYRNNGNRSGVSHHECDLCFGGSVHFILDASFKASYNIIGIFKGTIANVNRPGMINARLFNFYYSAENHPLSVHGGNPKFDLRATGAITCPNLSRMVTFNPRNAQNQLLTGAVVYVYPPAPPGMSVAAFGSVGNDKQFIMYLYPGSWTATAFDGVTPVSKNTPFTVASGSVTVTLTP